MSLFSLKLFMSLGPHHDDMKVADTDTSLIGVTRVCIATRNSYTSCKICSFVPARRSRTRWYPRFRSLTDQARPILSPGPLVLGMA
ncbi:hypothetical protein I79_008583 [Cricetulus griseus]|uniref:Uncharacterized protein n=1 Tax=Cricetulus griseus TaxID=10029 RepID=G3HDK0_CRIGR|nr:hypothetical protein I79_008583 [Cricetulus griseus]ERE84630.1 hypothetical protein H671_2g5812 [Cricetulus griseus]